MKKVYLILIAASFLIAACMIFLVFRGVSLRTEPLIKPSPVDDKYKNISYGVVHRMFPDFQKAEYVIWGLIPGTVEEGKIFELIQNEYQAQFGSKPFLQEVTEGTSSEEIRDCPRPCWILVNKEKASELPINSLLSKIRQQKGDMYFSVTMLEFERGPAVPAKCESEQRLEYSCILPISVREALRFMKREDERYFFMRRYNERDLFLFVEKASSSS